MTMLITTMIIRLMMMLMTVIMTMMIMTMLITTMMIRLMMMLTTSSCTPARWTIVGWVSSAPPTTGSGKTLQERLQSQTKVQISLLLFFNLLLGPPHHQHLDPVEPREFPRPRPLAAPLVAEQGRAHKNSEEENAAEHGAGFICGLCTKYLHEMWWSSWRSWRSEHLSTQTVTRVAVDIPSGGLPSHSRPSRQSWFDRIVDHKAWCYMTSTFIKIMITVQPEAVEPPNHQHQGCAPQLQDRTGHKQSKSSTLLMIMMKGEKSNM